MEILAIANQKGGACKTTTSLALGKILAESGKRVLLLDMDPQSSLTNIILNQELSQHKEYSFFALVNQQKPKIMPIKENLSLLPAHYTMSLIEKEGIKTGMGLLLQNFLSELRDFDHVLIDCPPYAGVLLVNALVAAHRVIIPLYLEPLSLHALPRMLANLANIERGQGLKKAKHILPVCVDFRLNLHKKILEDLKIQYPDYVSGDFIPLDAKLKDIDQLFFNHKKNKQSQSRGLLCYEQFLKQWVA
ncbi:MAG: ParA family protein [Gammaproteobacteria bacterium]